MSVTLVMVSDGTGQDTALAEVTMVTAHVMGWHGMLSAPRYQVGVRLELCVCVCVFIIYVTPKGECKSKQHASEHPHDGTKTPRQGTVFLLGKQQQKNSQNTRHTQKTA